MSKITEEEEVDLLQKGASEPQIVCHATEFSCDPVKWRRVHLDLEEKIKRRKRAMPIRRQPHECNASTMANFLMHSLTVTCFTSNDSSVERSLTLYCRKHHEVSSAYPYDTLFKRHKHHHIRKRHMKQKVASLSSVIKKMKKCQLDNTANSVEKAESSIENEAITMMENIHL